MSANLKRERRDEVGFLRADKHQTFLEVDANNYAGQGQSFAKYPK